MVRTECGADKTMTPTSETRGTARLSIPGRIAQRRTGFTLLELILVLSIIAMASVLIAPNIGSLDSRSFRAQVREANSLLNYARRLAIVKGQPTTATFTLVSGEDQEQLTRKNFQSIGSWRSQGAAIIYRDSTNAEVEIETQLEIGFFPAGGSTGGELILRQDDREATISIDPFSGRIETRFSDEYDN